MGTNYYAMRPPTQADKEKMAKLALSGNLYDLKKEIDSYEDIHIGKASWGWDFLFNLNGKRFYSSKEELIAWQKTVPIRDEYGETYTFDEFWNDVATNRMCNGKPARTHRSETRWADYYIVIDNLEFSDGVFS